MVEIDILFYGIRYSAKAVFFPEIFFQKIPVRCPERIFSVQAASCDLKHPLVDVAPGYLDIPVIEQTHFKDQHSNRIRLLAGRAPGGPYPQFSFVLIRLPQFRENLFTETF